MNDIVIDRGDVQVDASIIADGLRLAPALVQPLLREGHIASKLERGVDDDAGKCRLTFVHGRRELRLVIDQTGHVLERSATVLASPARHPRTGRRGGSTR
jgi:hypothetical protein